MSKSFKNDLTGQRFGRLTVLEFVPREGTKNSYWKCRCDCQKIVEVRDNHLKSKAQISCGCAKIKHNKANTRIYRIWDGIKRRCLNENNHDYRNYGGRGITICDEWKNNFQTFYDWSMENGYKDNLSIDRINVNGNYEPSNCRWVNWKIQARNTRVSTSVEYQGRTMSLPEAAELSGIPYVTLRNRYHKGDRGEQLFRRVEIKYRNKN